MESSSSILINGVWRQGASSREVFNPASGEVLSRQAEVGGEEVREAIEAASEALPGWSATPAFDRAGVLQRASELLLERAQRIGKTLALESGKLLAEAVGEVKLSADYFSWFAGEARRLQQAVAVDGRQSGPQVVLQKPAGVAATLTPWNFPVSIQARKVAPALAAGCTVVARPSEQAPASVVELFECLIEAGAPDGVVNLLTGPASEITEPIMEDGRVRVVSFTGSTGVGKSLYERAAGTMKRLSLELGGAAPFVVLEDADPVATLNDAMLAKFRNCGQSCVAANCFYVHESVYEEFVEQFGQRISALKLGDPLDSETTLGPVINAGQRRALEEMRERAVAGGMEPIAAAPPLAESSGLSEECFLVPELLGAPDHEEVAAGVLEQEVFGPLALVVGFSDVDELVPRLNRNPLGLAGYVFSRNVTKAMRVAASLEVGICGVNEGLATATNVPMGGVKDSGLGREGGHPGLEEFLEPQYMAIKDEPVSALFGGAG